MFRILALLGLLNVSCAHVSGNVATANHPEWVAAVEAYKDIDIQLFLAREESSIARLLGSRHELSSKIAKTTDPSKEDVRSLLRSPVDLDREKGLVLLAAHEWLSDEMLHAVLVGYNPSASFFSRYYSTRVMLLMDTARVRRLSSEVMKLLLSERDERARYSWLPILPVIDERDALTVLMEYMRTGAPSLQRGAYAVARSMGSTLWPSLRSELERAKAYDVIHAIEVLESQEGRTGPDQDQRTPAQMPPPQGHDPE